jgi:transcriptional regulator GlxA family with amidase domain
MHRIAVVAVPPVGTFELAIPELIFSAVRVEAGAAYEVRTCTAEPGVVAATGALSVVVAHGLEAIDDADTVIVTGTGARGQADPRILAALRDAAAAGKRIASICTGAFVLAQAGLLDGRDVTTHWNYAAELTQRFPTVRLHADVLFVEDGRVLTSAGLAAGIDLCLHIVRVDFGAAVANTVARLGVVAPVRPGGQAQFIATPLPPESGVSLAATRVWALEQLHRPLTRDDLAHHARVSVRTLTRRFLTETGTSPLQWLLHQRIQRAQELLETTDLSIVQVAERSGLGTADSLRKHLTRRTGLTPSSYRAMYTQLPH